MTQLRSTLVSLDATPWYHVVSKRWDTHLSHLLTATVRFYLGSMTEPLRIRGTFASLEAVAGVEAWWC